MATHRQLTYKQVTATHQSLSLSSNSNTASKDDRNKHTYKKSTRDCFESWYIESTKRKLSSQWLNKCVLLAYTANHTARLYVPNLCKVESRLDNRQ